MYTPDQAFRQAEDLVGRGYSVRVTVVPDERGDFARLDVLHRPGRQVTGTVYLDLITYAAEQELEVRPPRDLEAILELRAPAGP
jgi:hypothetical protein